MAAEQTAAPKPHWNKITPANLLVVLLAVEVILMLTERFYPKGWAATFIAGCVALTTLYLLIRIALARFSYRPFQYNIRIFVIFTVIFTISCSWMTLNLQEAARQKKAFGLSSGKVSPPPAPAWLRAMLGDDFFIDASDITGASFIESNVTDSDIKYIKGFKQLREIFLETVKSLMAGWSS